jgi:uncharacterized RDD family membrane protein YckC
VESRDELEYAGFWRRAAAVFLDALIVIGVALAIDWIVRPEPPWRGIPDVGYLVFQLFYSVYLVYRFGGTPGKLIMRLRIVRVDGRAVTLRRAFLRHFPEFLFSLLGFVGPSWEPYERVLLQIWIWSELIVMLTNKRRRALHDFIAGTVVIRRRFAFSDPLPVK